MSDDQSTLQAPAPGRKAGAAPRPALTLTVLYHPDASRIGEQAVVEREVALSRTEPGFWADGGAPRGLAFRGVSRTPLRIRRVPGGWELAADGPLVWTLDGAAVGDRAVLGDDDVRDGVIVDLGGWVLLQLRGGGQRSRRDHLGVIGVSPQTDALRDQLDRLATSPLPVFLHGETGTGKEVAARALHLAGPRAHRKFLACNLGALRGDSAVSQLFGHERGAFTGADAKSEGFFGMADGGTLLLDEVGEADDHVQPMLLRALEAHEIQPLGGRPRNVDVRLVFATDADLDQRVADGRFRRALLYRITQTRIDLPPLRERVADIPLQLVRFVGQLAAKHGMADPTTREGWLPIELVTAALAHAWPGNSRELRALAAKLVLDWGHAPRAELVFAPSPAPGVVRPTPAAQPVPRAELVGAAEVQAALEAADFRLAVAAEALGISRNTLHARMAEHGIRRPKDIGRDELVAARDSGDLEAAARRLGISARALRLRMRELGL